MNAIHKTKLSVTLHKLQELGVDNQEWHECNIILRNVSNYLPDYDEDGELIKENTSLYLNSDMGFTINTPYKQFDKLMQEYYSRK